MQSDPRAEDVFNDGLEIIERTGYAEFAAWHWWGIGNVRQIQGRDEEALALYERALAVADTVGEPVSSGITHASAGILRSDRGDAEEALAELGLAMERSVATGAGLAIGLLKLAIAYAQAGAGMLEEGRAALIQFIRQGAQGDLYGTSLGLCMLGRAELALGELDDAFDHAASALEIADGSLGNPAHAAAARYVLAGVALRRGDPAEAERLAHEALAMVVERDLRPGAPMLLDALAQAAAALDSNEEAARILGAAERAYRELGHARRPPEQATVDALVKTLRAEIGVEAATDGFAEGRAMETAEAIAWLRRARGTRKRPAGGWESLTPTELRVVELAAEGLSNPEIGKRMFISRGTAKVHLSHVYVKLGVRNHSELAALVARRGSRQTAF
jgi:DNA-binding CsgD family transcriptional regulator